MLPSRRLGAGVQCASGGGPGQPLHRGVQLVHPPNDKAEAEPTLAALSPELGTPPAAALDNGFWSEPNLAALEKRPVEPYIATGREPHHQSWQERFATEPAPPPENASAQVKMAYKLRTEIGQAS